MTDDVRPIKEIEEKKCPHCGTEAFAWVSTENGLDTFECRKCKALFTYRGDWEPPRNS